MIWCTWFRKERFVWILEEMTSCPSKGGKRLGRNGLIAVAIDKDKSSQYALRWAVDNLLAKGQTLVLIHVHKSSSASGNFPLFFSLILLQVAHFFGFLLRMIFFFLLLLLAFLNFMLHESSLFVNPALSVLLVSQITYPFMNVNKKKFLNQNTEAKWYRGQVIFGRAGDFVKPMRRDSYNFI